MKKFKVIIIGDSLAMPNFVDTKYEDTWVCLLKDQYPRFDFITYLKRGLTTDVLVTMGKKIEHGIPPGADCLEMYMPDVVILQLGICNCAPRLFEKNSFEYKLINRFPFKIIQKQYINIVKKYRKRSFKKALVPPKKFENNLRNYLDRCQKNNVLKVIIIAISFPDNRMIEKNKSIIEAVEKYNSIFFQVSRDYSNVELIFPLDARKYEYEIYYDGYHPNIKGHYIVFQAIRKLLDEIKFN